MELTEYPTVELKIIPEEEDEGRGNIIHNHLDECPICKTKYASTDLFGQSLLEYMEDRAVEDTAIYCQTCQTKFQLLKYDNEWPDNSIWMAINEKLLKLTEKHITANNKMKLTLKGRGETAG